MNTATRPLGRKRRPVRDRHGRSFRGRLIPATMPACRTASQLFDDTVVAAMDRLETILGKSLDSIEFAVEEVPGQLAEHDSGVLEDASIPLARVLDGQPHSHVAPRIVLYRRPLEARAADATQLADLVHAVLTEQVANVLGIDPEELM